MDSPLKWHGGKHYFARKFIALMPPHIHYVEAFAGSLAVLLEKHPTGISEVANDLHGDLTTFWKVLQREDSFASFVRRVQTTPCSQVEFNDAVVGSVDPVERAARFFIRCRQSRAGTFKDFTTLAKTRVRRGMNELPSAWWNAIDGLAEVHARLSRVVILNQNALDVIRKQDTPGTFFYLDPPYLHATRATTGQYVHEMSESEHAALLNVLENIKGKFMLSGYHSDLYKAAALRNGWTVKEFSTPNHAAGGNAKRAMTEVVWMNYESGSH